MSILIGADFVSTKHNVELYNSENVIVLVGKELLEILKGADYQIFNMEVPLTDKISPIDKCYGGKEHCRIFNKLTNQNYGNGD